MKALIITLLITGWYFYGWKRFAIKYAWRETEKEIKHYPTLYKTEEDIQHQRRENLVEGFMIGSIWPFAIMVRRIIDKAENKLPLQMRQIRAREEELIKREQELGIKLSPIPPEN